MDENELDIPTDVNLTCRRCGECCRRLDVPLTIGEKERLESVDWGSLEPTLKGITLAIQLPKTATSPGRRFRLARQNGRCVFLRGDNSCLIESHIGREAKPLACRQFPLVFVDEPQGPVVSASFVCSSILENSGEPLVSRKDEIRSLLMESSKQSASDEGIGWDGRVSIPSRIVLTAAIGLDWFSYQALERRMVTLLEDETHILVIRLLAWQRLFDGAIAQYGSGAKTSGPFVKWIEQMYSARGECWLYGLESGWKRGKPSKQRFLVAAAVPLMESLWPVDHASNGSILSQRLAIARSGGTVNLPSVAAKLDVRSMVGVRLDQDLPELRPLLVRYLRESLRRKLLLSWPNLRKGVQHMLLHLALAKWYSVALAASRGLDAVGVGELRAGIRTVESLYVDRHRLSSALAGRRLDGSVLNLLLDVIIDPEDLAADFSEGYAVR